MLVYMKECFGWLTGFKSKESLIRSLISYFPLSCLVCNGAQDLSTLVARFMEDVFNGNILATVFWSISLVLIKFFYVEVDLRNI